LKIEDPPSKDKPFLYFDSERVPRGKVEKDPKEGEKNVKPFANIQWTLKFFFSNHIPFA